MFGSRAYCSDLSARAIQVKRPSLRGLEKRLGVSSCVQSEHSTCDTYVQIILKLVNAVTQPLFAAVTLIEHRHQLIND